MPFIGKTPETGAFRLIDSITTSATDTYALTVQGDHYFPESARNLIVSLNGVTQAPETAYTVSGSHIVFASALTASDVIDYILVIGDAVDIGTPSDGTVGNAQLKASLDLSGKTLTFSNDQISGDAVDGGTISNFASTGIDDNATSTAITIDSSENVSITPSGGVITLGANGHITSKQSLDVATSGGRYMGASTRGLVGQIRIEQTTTSADGGYVAFDTCASGSTSPTERMVIDQSGNVGIGNLNPYTRLHVKKDSDTDYTPIRFVSTEPTALITNTTSGALNYASLAFTTESNGEFGIGAVQNSGNTASDFVFVSRDSGSRAERVRITSDGNLLVGTTNKLTSAELSAGETGIALRSGDLLIVSREAGAGVLVNRKTSDGDLIEFRKDGTTVGGIKSISGVVSGIVFDPRNVNSGGAGIGGTNGSSVAPMDRNGFSDADIDLGLSSIRWRDIYLSGGAYLGGTGSANHLDDYEEGTWTPTYIGSATNPTVSYSQQNGAYVKIGRTVIARLELRTNTASGGSGNLYVSGLPFTPTAITGNRAGNVLVGFTSAFAGESPQAGYLNHGISYAVLQTTRLSNAGSDMAYTVEVSDLASGSNGNYFFATFIYET